MAPSEEKKGSTRNSKAPTPAAINEFVANKKTLNSSVPLCVEVSENHALVQLEVPESAMRPGEYVFGPTQFGTADCAMWFACFGAAGRIEEMSVTEEMAVRFVRPCRFPKKNTESRHSRMLWARADIVARRPQSGKVFFTASVWEGNGACGEYCAGCERCRVPGDSGPSCVAQGSYRVPGGLLMRTGGGGAARAAKRVFVGGRWQAFSGESNRRDKQLAKL